LTKGTFDILHAGHLAVLSHCASLKAALSGGAVVVVVESDASVRSRKGPKRPFQTETERALQMALLPWVDRVLIADRDELGRVISEVAPIAYVKGMDTALDAAVATARPVTLPSSKNPELAQLQPEATVVVFTDDGTLSTSELVRRIQAAAAE
jgi:cytidyltransferase-like protein